MNADNNNLNEDNQDENEKFSDDPEEQLRIENDLLRLKLQAETGADIHQLQDVPPEIENAFLNNILAFERQLDNMEEVSIFEILDKPDHFKNESELSDIEVEMELERLTDFMKDKGIEVDYSAEYPARLKYKFITEELFLHETTRFDIPDMVNHYLYEEFHPNHELSIKGIAEDFLDMWLAKKIEDETFILADEFISKDNKIYAKEEFLKLIRHIFDAYLSFDNGSFEISGISFELTDDTNLQGLGFAEGIIQYSATLESKETILIKGPFKLYMSLENDYWAIMNIVMPGIEL